MSVKNKHVLKQNIKIDVIHNLKGKIFKLFFLFRTRLMTFNKMESLEIAFSVR